MRTIQQPNYRQARYDAAQMRHTIQDTLTQAYLVRGEIITQQKEEIADLRNRVQELEKALALALTLSSK